jgi:hypothetical protein
MAPIAVVKLQAKNIFTKEVRQKVVLSSIRGGVSILKPSPAGKSQQILSALLREANKQHPSKAIAKLLYPIVYSRKPLPDEIEAFTEYSKYATGCDSEVDNKTKQALAAVALIHQHFDIAAKFKTPTTKDLEQTKKEIRKILVEAGTNEVRRQIVRHFHPVGCPLDRLNCICGLTKAVGESYASVVSSDREEQLDVNSVSLAKLTELGEKTGNVDMMARVLRMSPKQKSTLLKSQVYIPKPAKLENSVNKIEAILIEDMKIIINNYITCNVLDAPYITEGIPLNGPEQIAECQICLEMKHVTKSKNCVCSAVYCIECIKNVEQRMNIQYCTVCNRIPENK